MLSAIVQAEKGESMWMVVGFEVMPCSIKREKGDKVEFVKCNPWGDPTNPEPQKIYEGADIIYTCASTTLREPKFLVAWLAWAPC